MSRSSMSWPVSILAGFGIFAVLLLIGALNQGAVAQDANCTPYPGCYRTAVAASKTAKASGASASQTQLAGTAVARTQLAQQGTCVRNENETYPCPQDATNTPPPTSGGTNDNNNQQPAATSTFTPTATRTVSDTSSAQPTTRSASNTPTATRSASPSDEQGPGVAPTPTPVLPAGITTVACIPGETVEFTGTTAPNTPLLLFFGERPVGGGLSDADGAYRLRLQVGDERPGLYLVEVRERGSRALVDQFGCDLPAFTPTPTSSP